MMLLAHDDGTTGAAIHAELAALTAMDVDEGGFISVDAHEGFGLADGLRRAAPADPTAVVVNP